MFTTMDTIQTVEGAASHPDAGVVTLGEQLRAAWSRERLVVATAPETDDGEAAVDAAVNETGAIADKIAGLQAMAFEGLCVKALALAWAQGADLFAIGDAGDTTQERLALGVARDVAMMVGWAG